MMSDDSPVPVSRMLGVASAGHAPMVRALTEALDEAHGAENISALLRQVIDAPDSANRETAECAPATDASTKHPLTQALHLTADLITGRASLSTEEGHRAIEEELLAILVENGPESLRTSIGRVLNTADTSASAGTNTTGPRRIGDYELLNRLGDGGFGVVFRARHTDTGQHAAIKLLRIEAATDARVHRFRDEARIAGTLDHPGIVRVLDSGVHDDGSLLLPWIASELVAGEPWNGFAARAPIEEMLAAFVAICEAITHAHDNGVIHRDLKPQNVLIDADGAPHVLDFGIAKVLGATSGHTRSDQLLGTPAYMAPEIARNGMTAASAISDVWALGAMLFEALAGRTPHTLDELPPRQALNSVATETPPRIESLCRGISSSLAAIITTATSPEQDRRYGSVLDLRDDVQRFLSGQRVHAKRATAFDDVARLVGRHRTLAIVVAVALLATLTGAGAALLQWQRAVQAENKQAQAAARSREAAAGSLEALVAAAQFAHEIGERTLVTSRIAELVEKPLALLDKMRASDDGEDQHAPEWLRVEADLREIMADAAVRAGKWTIAMPHRERVLAIERQLAGVRTPQPRSLARALVKLGDVARQLIEYEQLIQLYEHAHSIYEDRAQADPTDRAAADDLSWSYERMAFLDVHIRSEPARGIEMAHKRIALGRSILKRWPGVSSRHALSASLVFLLECLDARRPGRIPQVDLAKEALAVLQPAIRDDPTRRALQLLHINALRALARETFLAGDIAAMTAVHAELTGAADHLLQVDPDDYSYRLLALLSWRAKVIRDARIGRQPGDDLDRLAAHATLLPDDVCKPLMETVTTELKKAGFSAAAVRLHELQR